jgi:hypothetical protein
MPRCGWIALGLALLTAFPGCGRRDEPAAENSASGTDETRAPDEGMQGEPVAELADSAEAESVLVEGPPLFGYLKQFVGSSPVEAGLWKTQPLAPILYKVLGPRLEVLLRNMQETSPIREENGIIYLTGNKKYAADKAALVVDTRTDALYVWLLVAGRAEEYQWGDSVVLPKPVLELVERSDVTP